MRYEPKVKKKFLFSDNADCTPAPWKSTFSANAEIFNVMNIKILRRNKNYHKHLINIGCRKGSKYICSGKSDHIMKVSLSALALYGLLAIGCATGPAYKDATLSPEKRAADLLKRMTLEEKAAQLQCRWTDKADFLTEGKMDYEKAREVMPDGIGSLARMNEDLGPGHIPYKSTLHPREAASLYNDIQKYFVEQTRLGIPVMNHEEGLHGHQAMDATNFPLPIALASSWDRELFHDIYTVVAKEIRAAGGAQVLAPVVDITQDPRWGRTEETMGEDPYLAAEMGVIQVKAYQGTSEIIDNEHVGATLKHLGIHGRSEGGANTAPSFVDEHTAREFFFKPFMDCLTKARPFNVMVSYPELWGQPSHMNHHLVTDLLRDEWGFEGLVVSDYSGVSNLVEIDHATPDYDEAGVLGLMAGVDVELPSIKSYKNLAALVRCGRIPKARLDEAVRRILKEKFRLGLFEHPYVDVERADSLIGCKEHRALAYRAATEGMVLLQNRDNVLPLDPTRIKTLAVIGPNADKCVLGGYSSEPKQTVSLLDALKEQYGSEMNILYSEGVKLCEPGEYYGFREITEAENASRIDLAVSVASKADAVVLCLGENADIHREATGSYDLGDLPTLELLAGQVTLTQRIAALGKPTVALINSGTTLNLAPVAALVPAVMQCWYLGQESGYAMADALMGKINPSGKLTISFPRSAGHIPAYYNYKPSSRRGYNLGREITPLYPFGFGLSYTSFAYSKLRVDKAEMTASDTATISVDVTNTGSREGTEIVQLYITDDYALMPRTVKELKGFERVDLASGETKTVSFTIGFDELAYWSADNRRIVEPGSFTIQAGPSSAEGEKLKINIK